MEYFFDDEYAPVRSMSERKSRAKRYSQEHPECSPLISTGKNLAQSFWGKHWCWYVHKLMEDEIYLSRGRSVLRAGEVVNFALVNGILEAQVLGQSETPYLVKISCDSYGEETLCKLSDILQVNLTLVSELLGGTQAKSAHFDWLVDEAEIFFPRSEHLDLSCTCPELGMLCEHRAAALYAFGVHLDTQPLDLFKWQGVSKADLLRLSSQEDPAKESTDNEKLAAQFGFDLLDL